MAALRTILFSVAVLVLAQSAHAGLGKIKSYSPASSYGTYQPMTCSGVAYCFPPKSEKIGQDPMCPQGWTFDAVKGECTLPTSAKCPNGCHSKQDKYGKLICSKCPLGYTMNVADGQCEKPCKDGYVQKSVGGGKFCVESCKDGWTANGQVCIATDTKLGSYKPKECSAKACLFKYELYFISGGSGYASSGSAAGKALAASYAQEKGGSSRQGPPCMCMATTKRDLYEQDCKDPSRVDPEVSYMTQDTVCLGGEKPFLGKKCKGVCPVDYSPILLGAACQRKCPAGMQPCKSPLGEPYCAPVAPLLGCDSCDILNKLWMHLDKDAECKYVAPRPAPKASTPRPKAATKSG